MPGPSFITNPNAALRTLPAAGFVNGQDSSGADLDVGVGISYTIRANAAITRGQALMWVAPTATVPLSVTPFTAAADEQIFAGCAFDNTAAGDNCLVIREGFCTVKFDTGSTAAFGSVFKQPVTATGDFEIIADPIGGADAPPVLGLCLGVEIGTTDTCFGYIGWVPATDFIA